MSQQASVNLAGKQASAYWPLCSVLVFANVVAWMRCWLMSLLRPNAGLHRVLCRQLGQPTSTATRCNSMSHAFPKICACKPHVTSDPTPIQPPSTPHSLGSCMIHDTLQGQQSCSLSLKTLMCVWSEGRVSGSVRLH